MDDTPEPPQKDDPTASPEADPLPEVIPIAPNGDILLDMTFENSKATLKATRKAIPKPRPNQRVPTVPVQPPALLKPRIRLAYRVDQATLQKHSRYFANLLGDTRFHEGRSIAAQLDRLHQLSSKDAVVAAAEALHQDLPRVAITDDDEATRSAGREHAFADLLRILHGGDAITRPITMLYIVNLAVLADRFACTATVARYLVGGLKAFKWPATPPSSKPRDSEGSGGLGGLSLAAEEMLRQKVLVSWLMEQAGRFSVATRELVLFGSRRWKEEEAESGNEEAEDDERFESVWWYLPDGLEEELHHRRQLLLNMLSSIPTHFLNQYTQRRQQRQCKLGYDSSAACDSFQLGEMVKFLVSKDLLALTTFASSTSPAASRDFAAVDLHAILAALKQCPTYQLDRFHTNCGLRTRLMPILEYVGAMLGANVIAIPCLAWKKDRVRTSWMIAEEDCSSSSSSRIAKKAFVVGDDESQTKKKMGRVFRFTRAIAGDQRLRYEGAMSADRLARELFTADAWDWTPEDAEKLDHVGEFGHLSMPVGRRK